MILTRAGLLARRRLRRVVVVVVVVVRRRPLSRRRRRRFLVVCAAQRVRDSSQVLQGVLEHLFAFARLGLRQIFYEYSFGLVGPFERLLLCLGRGGPLAQLGIFFF